jgi:hypothetical protein
MAKLQEKTVKDIYIAGCEVVVRQKLIIMPMENQVSGDVDVAESILREALTDYSKNKMTVFNG